MDKEETKHKLELLIREQKSVDREIRQAIQEYCDSTDESLPYKKIIREEFGLVI